jgi:hypothetical protein
MICFVSPSGLALAGNGVRQRILSPGGKSLHFHEDVENPIRSSLCQASADFDNADQIGPIGDSTPVVPAGTPAPPVSGTGRPRAQTFDRRYGDLPDARDDHLLRLTDSTGMLQHATLTIPNYRHGCCVKPVVMLSPCEVRMIDPPSGIMSIKSAVRPHSRVPKTI